MGPFSWGTFGEPPITPSVPIEPVLPPLTPIVPVTPVNPQIPIYIPRGGYPNPVPGIGGGGNTPLTPIDPLEPPGGYPNPRFPRFIPEEGGWPPGYEPIDPWWGSPNPGSTPRRGPPTPIIGPPEPPPSTHRPNWGKPPVLNPGELPGSIPYRPVTPPTPKPPVKPGFPVGPIIGGVFITAIILHDLLAFLNSIANSIEMCMQVTSYLTTLSYNLCRNGKDLGNALKDLLNKLKKLKNKCGLLGFQGNCGQNIDKLIADLNTMIEELEDVTNKACKMYDDMRGYNCTYGLNPSTAQQWISQANGLMNRYNRISQTALTISAKCDYYNAVCACNTEDK